MADPSALQTAVAAAQAVQLIGMPEGRIVLAEAVVHLATAPKSNAAYLGIDAALADVRAGKAGSVRPTCATRTTRAPSSSVTVRATGTRTTRRTASPRSSTCRTPSSGRGTTRPRTAGTSGRSRTGSGASATSSGRTALRADGAGTATPRVR